MPTHAEIRKLPYSADQMFMLVGDVEAYPEFLPWCVGTRIRDRKPGTATTPEVIEAELVISFKLFRERFGSRVTLHHADQKIDVEYLDGPFKYLNNHWKFRDLPEGGCEVDFFVDFEFKSRVLQAVIGLVFHEAMKMIVGAFETRARALYDARD